MGATDKAGIADIIVESALTTIADMRGFGRGGRCRGQAARLYQTGSALSGAICRRALKRAGAGSPARSQVTRPTPQAMGPLTPCPARSLMFVAQCRPPDDQSRNPTARWIGDPGRHHGRGVHQRNQHARCRGQGPLRQFALRARSTSSSPRCTGPEECKSSPTTCSMRWKTCSAFRATTIKVGGDG